jgi:prophage antirepressor-like protein
MVNSHKNSTPAVFDFHGASVRTLMINGEPWFVAKDVAEVLGYARPSDAIRQHCKGASKHRIQGGNLPSGVVDTYIVPERDVYRLVMRSKLPAAEKFEEWVVSEVLPQIRKTGSYNTSEPAWLANLTPQAKIAIEDLNNQVEALTDETNRLQGVCNDLADNLVHGITPAAFGRQLNGVNVQQINKTLVYRGYLIKTKHGYRASAYTRDKYFTERRDANKEGFQYEEVVLTARGAKRLYAMYEKGELVMKKDWDGEYRHELHLIDEVAA